MFHVYYWGVSGRITVGGADNLDRAIALLPPLHLLEEDHDNPGCYDAITRHGQVYAIEREETSNA